MGVQRNFLWNGEPEQKKVKVKRSRKGTRLNELQYFRQPMPHARKRMTSIQIIPTAQKSSTLIGTGKSSSGGGHKVNKSHFSVNNDQQQQQHQHHPYRHPPLRIDVNQPSFEMAVINYTNSSDSLGFGGSKKDQNSLALVLMETPITTRCVQTESNVPVVRKFILSPEEAVKRALANSGVTVREPPEPPSGFPTKLEPYADEEEDSSSLADDDPLESIPSSELSSRGANPLLPIAYEPVPECKRPPAPPPQPPQPAQFERSSASSWWQGSNYLQRCWDNFWAFLGLGHAKRDQPRLEATATMSHRERSNIELCQWRSRVRHPGTMSRVASAMSSRLGGGIATNNLRVACVDNVFRSRRLESPSRASHNYYGGVPPYRFWR
ncbi:hypothetical protein TKK_0009741 [Trichogramma kaykai]